MGELYFKESYEILGEKWKNKQSQTMYKASFFGKVQDSQNQPSSVLRIDRLELIEDQERLGDLSNVTGQTQTLLEPGIQVFQITS